MMLAQIRSRRLDVSFKLFEITQIDFYIEPGRTWEIMLEASETCYVFYNHLGKNTVIPVQRCWNLLTLQYYLFLVLKEFRLNINLSVERDE